jgi:hypothetical protein
MVVVLGLVRVGGEGLVSRAEGVIGGGRREAGEGGVQVG